MNPSKECQASEYREGDVEGQIREIKKFIAHRMERGFMEWSSK